METKDLLELAEALENRVNSYWNFYAVANFAVAAWLITGEGDLNTATKALVTVGLAAFFLANLAVIARVEQRIRAVESEVERQAQSVKLDVGLELKRHLSKMSIPHRTAGSVILHLIIDAALIAMVWVAA